MITLLVLFSILAVVFCICWRHCIGQSMRLYNNMLPLSSLEDRKAYTQNLFSNISSGIFSDLSNTPHLEVARPYTCCYMFMQIHAAIKDITKIVLKYKYHLQFKVSFLFYSCLILLNHNSVYWISKPFIILFLSDRLGKSVLVMVARVVCNCPHCDSQY